MIHQYKDFTGGHAGAHFKWEGQTTQAPSASTVFLQIYNNNSTTWENLASNSSASVNTDFILESDVTDLTNYRDVNGVTTCRVYQAAI